MLWGSRERKEATPWSPDNAMLAKEKQQLRGDQRRELPI